MARKRKHKRKSLHIERREEPGAPPGRVTPVPNAPRARISAMLLNGGCSEHRHVSIDDIRRLAQQPGVIWVDVDGLGDADVVRQIGALFQLHPLALEDVVNVHQRAKVDDYSDHVFIVVRMAVEQQGAKNDGLTGELLLHTEQVSIFLGEHYVVTFQEHPGGDCLEPLRQRLRRCNEGVRVHTADFLAYSIIDGIVDGYFPRLERLGEQIEAIEEAAAAATGPEVIHDVHFVKAELLVLRRAIWPLREALNMLARDQHRFILPETRPYFRDCYDHAIQLMELIETYRELIADARDLYMSGVSNRLNEIMKVLTVISTIFIPLNFIAGIYGMNFNTEASPWNMPELHWRFGYPLAIGFMALVACGLLMYFRRLGWIGPPKEAAK